MPKATAPAAATGWPEKPQIDRLATLLAMWGDLTELGQERALERIMAPVAEPAAATGLPSPGALEQIDHVSFTKDLVEAALMAVHFISDPIAMNALATLCHLIVERLEALEKMLGADDGQVRS